MTWKNTKQISLADALVVEHKALHELDDVQQLVDWSRIEQLLSDVHNNKKGEKAWPPLRKSPWQGRAMYAPPKRAWT